MEAVGKSVTCASPSSIARVRVGGSKPSAAAGLWRGSGTSQLRRNATLNCSVAGAGPVASSSRDGRVDISAAFLHAGTALRSNRNTVLTSRLLRSRNSWGAGPAAGVKCRNRQLVVRGNDRPSAGERVVAAVSYFLPLLDGIQYGRYFFQQFPAAESAFYPLFPLLQAYKSIPYSNLIVFFTLYLGVVRNDRTSRYVKFNAMQAVVLDVLLILPQVIERIVSPRSGFGFQIFVLLYNTLFLFLVVSFVYGVISCLLGNTPRLPLVADAADAQV